jgi:glycosyltransferase involved in cell wall biosynthesis
MLIGLIPVFNEEKTIIGVLNQLEKKLDYIVIVNDGSFDKTDSLISNWARNKKNVYYLSFKKNKGMSYALLQGFRFVSQQRRKGRFSHEDAIVMLDGDGQHDPDEINNMYEYFKNNNRDVLIAERDFSGYPSYRILGNSFLSLIASYLGKFKFRDIECGFKMMKIAFIENLLNYYIGYRYSCAGEIGIAASLLGYKVDNNYKICVPYYRKRGPSFIDFFINLILYLLVVIKIKRKKNKIFFE